MLWVRLCIVTCIDRMNKAEISIMTELCLGGQHRDSHAESSSSLVGYQRSSFGVSTGFLFAPIDWETVRSVFRSSVVALVLLKGKRKGKSRHKTCKDNCGYLFYQASIKLLRDWNSVQDMWLGGGSILILYGSFSSAL